MESNRYCVPAHLRHPPLQAAAGGAAGPHPGGAAVRLPLERTAMWNPSHGTPGRKTTEILVHRTASRGSGRPSPPAPRHRRGGGRGPHGHRPAAEAVPARAPHGGLRAALDGARHPAAGVDGGDVRCTRNKRHAAPRGTWPACRARGVGAHGRKGARAHAGVLPGEARRAAGRYTHVGTYGIQLAEFIDSVTIDLTG